MILSVSNCTNILPPSPNLNTKAENLIADKYYKILTLLYIVLLNMTQLNVIVSLSPIDGLTLNNNCRQKQRKPL